MFVAIAVHKTVIAFCLGFEMFKSYTTRVWRAVVWMMMFTLAPPLGIVLGIVLTSNNIDETAKSLTSGVLQGVSTGVFLYVTFLEILCSYMGQGRTRDTKLVYFLSAACGFAIMAAVKVLDHD